MGLQYGGDYRGMRKISVQDLFRSDQDMTISRIMTDRYDRMRDRVRKYYIDEVACRHTR